MNIVDFAEARLARGYPSCFPVPAAARGRLRPPPRDWPRAGQALLMLCALLAAFIAGRSQAAPEPSDAQLTAIVRQYGAGLAHPTDPVTGRAVRVARTPEEWVVTLIDPRRLDARQGRYVGGVRRAYHIDRATRRVVAVVVSGG
jgi:hypothetical protein